jgi:hypothetical protein
LTDGLAPALGDLERWLDDLVVRGIRAVRDEDVPELLALHAVQRRALIRDSPGSQLAALEALIRDMTAQLRDDNLRRLAAFAFGLHSRDSLPMTERFEQAAKHPHIEGSGSKLRREPRRRLVHDLAVLLHLHEARLRARRALEDPEEDIEEVATTADAYLRRLDFYAVLSLWAGGLGSELGVALAAHAGDDRAEFTAFGESALWHWSQYLFYLYRYDLAYSNQFLLDTPDNLSALVASANDLSVSTPLTPRDRSYLRIEIADSYHNEMHPFLTTLENSSYGRRIIEDWFDWLGSCECDPAHGPRAGCEPHRLMRDADTFHGIIDKELSQPFRDDRIARFLTLPDVFGLGP